MQMLKTVTNTGTVIANVAKAILSNDNKLGKHLILACFYALTGFNLQRFFNSVEWS